MDLIGQSVDSYRVLRKVAEDPRTIQYQAVQGVARGLLSVVPDLSQNPRAVARFLRSAEALRRVRHKGLRAGPGLGKLPDGSPTSWSSRPADGRSATRCGCLGG